MHRKPKRRRTRKRMENSKEEKDDESKENKTRYHVINNKRILSYADILKKIRTDPELKDLGEGDILLELNG